MRAVQRRTGSVAPEERGPLLEGWVLSLLRTYAEERELYEEIFYWAPAEARGIEVDFLLRRGREHLAIEVRANPRYSTAMIAGLRAIVELPRLARRILIYGGTRSLRTADGIDVWPVDRFLRALAKDELWS